MYCVRHLLENTIITVSDIWLEENVFQTEEHDSWYCTQYISGETDEWCITTDERNRIRSMDIGGENSWVMMGSAYINKSFSDTLRSLLEEYFVSGLTDCFWENIIMDTIGTINMKSLPVADGIVLEFDSLDDLCRFDSFYCDGSCNPILETIAVFFNVPLKEIHSFKPLKSGMTNNSFSCIVNHQTYVVRVPYKQEKLIDRKEEYEVYKQISRYREELPTEKLYYFDAETGVKIAGMIDHVREADPYSISDVLLSMDALRRLHELKIEVATDFDFLRKIAQYESYVESCFLPWDYECLKSGITEILGRMDSTKVERVLCHVDSAFSNILISSEKVYLIDWEYAAMCDPLIDIAMYSIFADYGVEEVGFLLKAYLKREPFGTELQRVYSYAAAGGLLWGIWSDYKKTKTNLNIDVYRDRQYEYARQYIELAKKGCI